MVLWSATLETLIVPLNLSSTRIKLNDELSLCTYDLVSDDVALLAAVEPNLGYITAKISNRRTHCRSCLPFLRGEEEEALWRASLHLFLH